MKVWKVFLVCTIAIGGCEEVVDRSIVSGEPKLVVEGVLTNERTRHTVKLSRSYAGQDGSGTPVSGALVRVTEGLTEYPLTENPAVPGEYDTPDMRAVFGRTYILHIRYMGQDYEARDSSTPVEPLTPLQYRAVTDGYVLTMNKSGQDPNYIRHEINWENTSVCQGNCEALVVFYDLKTIDVNEVTKPDKEEFVFPAGSTVVRRKYSVSPAYKSFLRAVMSETEWRGSVFDVDRANAPTNLSNGAIGFFAVTTVTTDSTVVK